MLVFPAHWEAKVGGSLEPRGSEKYGETLLLKYKKISQVWWHVPVVPATWEAEAELLEPGRQRLQ